MGIMWGSVAIIWRLYGDHMGIIWGLYKGYIGIME